MGYILITGGNLINKGAQAMTFIAVDEIKRRFPGREVVVISDVDAARSDEELSRYRFLFRDSVCLFGRKYKLVQHRYGKLDRHGDAAHIRRNVEMIVDVSGYTFGSHWGVLANLLAAYRARQAFRMKVPIYFMPQSFGPFTWTGLKRRVMEGIIKKWLGYAEVFYCREKQGFELMHARYHLPCVRYAADLVLANRGVDREALFQDMPKQAEAEQTISQIRPHSVGILPNVRNEDCGTPEKMNALYGSMIDTFLAMGRTVYLIRHAAQDEKCCTALKEHYRDDGRVVLLACEFDCFAYSELAKRFDYLVASRYHAVVHAYKAGTPCIVPGWAVKYQELMQLFGQEAYGLDVRTAEPRDAQARIRRMEENYEKEAALIRERLGGLQRENVFDVLNGTKCRTGLKYSKDSNGSNDSKYLKDLDDSKGSDGSNDANELKDWNVSNDTNETKDSGDTNSLKNLNLLSDGKDSNSSDDICIKETKRGHTNVMRIADDRQCVSCGICAAVCPADCIRYERKDGYYLPVIDEEACLHCGRCARVCYGGAGAEAVSFQKPQRALTARAKEERILLGGTSGGTVTALVERLLQDGIYDNAYLAEAFTDDGQLFTREFAAGEELGRTQKSRYVPVSQQYAVKGILSDPDKRTIYVGTACAVYGLLEALKLSGRSRDQVLIIGLFCDRMQTYSIYDYFRERYRRKEPQRGRLTGLYFRDKRAGGWPGNMRLTFEDGSSIDVSAKERMIVKDFFRGRRCVSCGDKLNRQADISVGDNYTGKNSDRRGSNSVLIYTERGAAAWEHCADAFETFPSTVEAVCKSQHTTWEEAFCCTRDGQGRVEPQAPDDVENGRLQTSGDMRNGRSQASGDLKKCQAIADCMLGEQGDYSLIEKEKKKKKRQMYRKALRERLHL